MKLKTIVLGIGIFVVYSLAFWQGIQTFYLAPEWSDFCDSYPRKLSGFDNNCTFPDRLYDKESQCYKTGGYFVYDYGVDGCILGGHCDECQLNYDAAKDDYSRNLFLISLIIGVVTLIIGFSILKIEPVGSALLGSGIYAIFYGTVWNWRNFGSGIRFALLFLVLIILIWIAIKLNKKKKGFLERLFDR